MGLSSASGNTNVDKADAEAAGGSLQEKGFVVTSVDAVMNWMRGQWTMHCDRGAMLVAITLAPTMPPKVQHLSVRSIEPGAATRPPACGPF